MLSSSFSISCVEAKELSENIDISLPVCPFHICTVPSQEATLPEDAKQKMSFTTCQGTTITGIRIFNLASSDHFMRRLHKNLSEEAAL